MKKGLRQVWIDAISFHPMFESRPYEEGIKTLLPNRLLKRRRFESRPYEEVIKTRTRTRTRSLIVV